MKSSNSPFTDDCHLWYLVAFLGDTETRQFGIGLRTPLGIKRFTERGHGIAIQTDRSDGNGLVLELFLRLLSKEMFMLLSVCV